jgi:hypothetical protein
MSKQLPSEWIWKELEDQIFAVIGMVNARGESRTAGIVYVVNDKVLYISTGKDSWKARHIRGNSHVSMTVPIAKRVPLMPWIKVPAATITFSGKARVYEPGEVDQEILSALLQGMEEDKESLSEICVIEIQPQGDFVTYGVGVSLLQMRDPVLARGRAPVQ